MKQKDLKCLKCDYSASIKSNLVRHYARHHEPKEDKHEEYVNGPIDTSYAVKAEPIEAGSWDASMYKLKTFCISISDSHRITIFPDLMKQT